MQDTPNQAPEDKPVREISSQAERGPSNPGGPSYGHSSSSQPRSRKGALNVRRVRFASFVVIGIGLFATALLCILAIWDYAKVDTAWRAVATLGVVVGTLIAFVLFNETLGSKIDD